jgi:hypothetical protein
MVTYDVASRFQLFRSKTFSVPKQHDQIFKDFQRHLLLHIQQSLPNFTVKAIDVTHLRCEICREGQLCMRDKSVQVVLSNSPEIADQSCGNEGLVLNINRLFDAQGEMIGYGARFGFDYLDIQFETLVRKIANRSVVLIEHGSFTGGTLRFILKKLTDRGVKVNTIVVGFCGTKAERTIKEIFDGEFVIVHPDEQLIEWIPDHDLIPFTPNCGRVFGEKVPHSFAPVVTSDGMSCAYPYILPFGRTEEWASLPKDSALKLSLFCLETAIEIFKKIGKQNRREITIGDLLNQFPRVSMPIEIGKNHEVPSLERGVVGFLSDVLKKLK